METLAIPGYDVRAATMDDAEAVTQLVQYCEQVDLGEVLVELSDVVADWSRDDIDVARDVIVIEHDGVVVGWAQQDGLAAEADVHPDHRGRGLGSHLAGWTEAHATLASDGGPWQLGQSVGTTADGGRDLLAGRGYVETYTSWLLRLPSGRPLPPMPATPGITIRPAAGEADEVAAHRIIEAAFTWPGRTPRTLDGWRAVTVQHDAFEPGLLHVAERGDGRVVGAAVGLRYSDEGWIHQLAVEAAHRGRGIGRALMVSLFGRFLTTGSPGVGLATDSRTGAVDLYTRFGLEITQTMVRLDLRGGEA